MSARYFVISFLSSLRVHLEQEWGNKLQKPFLNVQYVNCQK